MHDVLTWLESSALGHAMRQTGPWTYAIVNLTHILGIATLFGSVLVMDLRLIGYWRAVPIAQLARAVVPITIIGLTVALISGIALFATKATDYEGNPFLLVKFPAIAVGVINAAVLRRFPPWRDRTMREPSAAEQRVLARFGAVSLASWLTAIAAGRLIAYW